MSHEQAELKKEFELERMILFSDAVFAIAITLLIIELKFPEVDRTSSSAEVMHAFRPIIIRFIAFALSFFFVGVMWARHLKIFKYLHTYDNGVIGRNLVFLFFIVCFPFTASGLTEHMSPGFLLPIFIYFINITLVWGAQYFLCAYIFNHKNQLTVEGFEPEKKFLLVQSKYLSLSLFITVVVTIALTFLFEKGSVYPLYGFYVMVILIIMVRKRLKKFKPSSKPD